MNTKLLLGLILILNVATIPSNCNYYSNTVPNVHLREKVTHLHFFLFDFLSGSKPSSVEVARANISKYNKSPTPFGSLYAIDDPLREGPEVTSKVIGNARGLYVSSSENATTLTLLMCVDYGFTTGKFNGSSFVVVSRNSLTESKREIAIVGGRGKFKMARGFAKLKTHYLNMTNGDFIVEYKVTLIHY